MHADEKRARIFCRGTLRRPKMMLVSVRLG